MGQVRYNGGMQLKLRIMLAGGMVRVPVAIRRLDVDAEIWFRGRLAPLPPYLGEADIAFVELPSIKFDIVPLGFLNVSKAPVLAPFLNQLLGEQLPGEFVLPKMIHVDVPPDPAALEAAQSSAKEGRTFEATQGSFIGELTVRVLGAEDLAVGLLPWNSNPYVQCATPQTSPLPVCLEDGRMVS